MPQFRLTPDQEGLLHWLVDNTPNLGEQEAFFATLRDRQEWVAIAPNARERRPIRLSDLEQLRQKGAVTYIERGPPASASQPVYERIAVTFEGFDYIAQRGKSADKKPSTIQENLGTLLASLETVHHALVEKAQRLLMEATTAGTPTAQTTKEIATSCQVFLENLTDQLLLKVRLPEGQDRPAAIKTIDKVRLITDTENFQGTEDDKKDLVAWLGALNNLLERNRHPDKVVAPAASTRHCVLATVAFAVTLLDLLDF